MAYRVLDPNGIGYSHEGGTTVIPKGAILEDKLIADGSFRQEFIDKAISLGRLEKASGEKASPIAPDNRKLPEPETKKESKDKKNKKGK